MRQRTASRHECVCARAMAEPRLGCGPPAVVVLHDVKQPASQHPPRSTSRSRAASLRRGLSFLFVSTASPLPWPTIRRACARTLGRHQLRPRNEGGRRSAGRRHCRRRARKVATLTLARRARPAQPGRPPLGAPPWRCRPRPALPLRHCRRVGRDGCSRQALSCLTAEPGFSYPRVTSRGRRHSPLRLLDRLRKTPLMSEDGESSTIYSLRSQQLNSYRSRSATRYADQAAGNVPDHAARI
jgi:hypothetical protein